MKIYVVGSSKNKFLPLDDIREKFLIDEKHEGDNIDFLNPWYCELTGLYYLWKHVDDDIVGLEHYRRYFVNDTNNTLLSETEILRNLKEHDVLCKKWKFKEHRQSSPMTFWNEPCNKSKLMVLNYFLENCIEDKKLCEYLKSRMISAEEFCQCNMFIGKKQIIDSYCQWLFSSLANIKDPNVFKNVSRVVGYVSEFIFGFWLEYNNVKIKYNHTIEKDKNSNRIIKRDTI